MTWLDFINGEKEKPYYQELKRFVDDEYQNFVCYPPYKNIYHALSVTHLDAVKVVILGQDPYHGAGQAHGLAFSVLCSKIPPSLQNIYKEMESDLGRIVNQDGNLEYLASQGVLLLNTILTVRQGSPLSHKGRGWETFTDNAIKLLDSLDQPICFILWGSNAITKSMLLTNPKHLILKSVHPSPLSAYGGFFGSRPFSKANNYLEMNGLTKINWIK